MLDNYQKLEEIGKGKPSFIFFIIYQNELILVQCVDFAPFLTWAYIQIFAFFVLGSFGRVSKVRRVTDGRVLVQKELDYGKMNDKEKQQIVAEVNILRDLQHPNIVRYYDRCIDKRNLKLYIIMEYCEKGDLQ